MEDNVNELRKEMDAKTNIMGKEMESKTKKLEQILEDHQTVTDEIKKQINDMRDPPVAFHCAFKSSRNHVLGKPVVYDSLFYERTNEFTAEAGLDLGSGRYTVG